MSVAGHKIYFFGTLNEIMVENIVAFLNVRFHHPITFQEFVGSTDEEIKLRLPPNGGYRSAKAIIYNAETDPQDPRNVSFREYLKHWGVSFKEEGHYLSYWGPERKEISVFGSESSEVRKWIDVLELFKRLPHEAPLLIHSKNEREKEFAKKFLEGMTSEDWMLGQLKNWRNCKQDPNNIYYNYIYQPNIEFTVTSQTTHPTDIKFMSAIDVVHRFGDGIEDKIKALEEMDFVDFNTKLIYEVTLIEKDRKAGEKFDEVILNNLYKYFNTIKGRIWEARDFWELFNSSVPKMSDEWYLADKIVQKDILGILTTKGLKPSLSGSFKFR